MQTARFTIPPNVHLLIPTPSRVLVWDARGLGVIFRSSKRGIVAAREAGDGVLAVADQHTVVLHDSKRVSGHGGDRSWGLNADEDQVRHLAYSRPAQRLYLSTALTGDILDFSPERSRLRPTVQSHATPPTALAVSSMGQWMVSASDTPPTIYLKHLDVADPPVLIQPAASEAAAHVAVFHPERPNVFLLAFRDGTVAAYDITQMVQHDGVTLRDGEIAHLIDLHRPTSKIVSRDGIGIRQTSVTAAAFLPGYKTRAISVGSDGRCKLFDFADNGFVLRTWHAKGPLTSLSMLSIRHPMHERAVDSISALRRRRGVIASSRTHMGGATSTDNIIAVGRVDGVVQIYDSVGLLLIQRIASENAERVISLEWVHGPSPDLLKDADPIVTDATHVQPVERGTVKTTPASKTGFATRKFTIHPDEIHELGTVRHIPQNNRGFQGATHYPDLFSPAKPSRTSPRNRPRVSSKTFVKSQGNIGVSPLSCSPKAITAQGMPLMASPSAHVKDRLETSESMQDSINASTLGRAENHVSEAPPRKVFSFKKARNEGSLVDAIVSPTREVELRDASRRPAPKTRGHAPRLEPHKHRHMHPSLKAPAVQKHWHPGNVLEREDTWPTDSLQDQPLHTDGENIWITSESDMELETTIEGHHSLVRGIEDKTWRKGLDQFDAAKPYGNTRVLHLRKSVTDAPTRAGFSPAPPIPHMDGSTDEDMFSAATHLSPSGAFSPSSEHVRELFPRVSSLSRHRRHVREEHRQNKLAKHHQPWQELAADAAADQRKTQARGPWMRLQQRREQVAGIPARKTVRNDPKATESGPWCVECRKKTRLVAELTEERDKLRAEVMRLRQFCRGMDGSHPGPSLGHDDGYS